MSIVCAGRERDDAGNPLGEPCGRRPPERHRDDLAVLRAGGWRIGPERPDGTRDVMCPRCARPDPALQQSIRDLRRQARDKEPT